MQRLIMMTQWNQSFPKSIGGMLALFFCYSGGYPVMGYVVPLLSMCKILVHILQSVRFCNVQ